MHISFQDFIKEDLMIFGKASYPKFGHVLIMAGGAGSGKGFTLSRLIGLEGKVFDPDALKTLAQGSRKFRERIKTELDVDIGTDINLKNPEDVSRLHEILSSIYRLPKKVKQTTYASILTAPADRKPNLIFDTTLDEISKLRDISKDVQALGYDKKNIHIVWVINDIKVARDNNAKRSRTVHDWVLNDTHSGASATFREIFNMGKSLQSQMDGDIYFAFNKAKVDATLAIGDKKESGVLKRKAQGSYVTNAMYVKIKKQGKPITPFEEISTNVLDKLKQYVPNSELWETFQD